MSTTLHLLAFNNYYNRRIVRYKTIQQYQPYILHTYQDRNFVPGDGITTTAISNYSGEQPDYMVVTDEYSNIVSRWWVIDAVRVVGGQFRLSLLRDLVADFYYAATSAECLIQRATPLSLNDPAIYNTQDMSFNQIRQQPQLLYDKSKTPWIVGYIPSDAFQEDTTISTVEYIDKQAAIEVDGIQSWQFFNTATDNLVYTPTTQLNLQQKIFQYQLIDGKPVADVYSTNLNAQIGNDSGLLTTLLYRENIQGLTAGQAFAQAGIQRYNQEYAAATAAPGIYAAVARDTIDNSLLFKIPAAQITANTIKAVQDADGFQSRLATQAQALNSQLTRINVDDAACNRLKALSGQTIKDTVTGIVYNIEVKETYVTAKRDVVRTQQLAQVVNNAVTGALGAANNLSTNLAWAIRIKANQNDMTQVIRADIAVPETITFPLELKNTYKRVYAELRRRTLDAEVTIKSASTRQHLTDAPYDMFCIPYSQLEVITSQDESITTQPGVGINIGNAIAKGVITDGDASAGGSASIYDLQLLPYCPVQQALTADGTLDARRVDYSQVTVQDIPVNVIIWCSSSNFNFTIPKRIISTTQMYSKKINALTKFCRLCSPNGSGMFQFTPEKNGGLQEIEVNCTYKPFQPYIHLKPRFGVLYGEPSSIDYRGLICGGDFSVAQLSNAWANYQQNNSNYQAIFDRQIQNLQLTQDVQRSREVLSGVTSTVSGAISGATKGASSGGVWGGVAGAAVGAGVNAAMAGVNYAMNERLRDQAVDYSTAMFGYNLGNIKAIPTAISKTAANVVNNPLIPYLERYICTTEEQEALRNYLQYRGFRIGRMGTINDYQQSNPTYIKATPIQIPDIAEGYHIANALAAELTKGVYI